MITSYNSWVRLVSPAKRLNLISLKKPKWKEIPTIVSPLANSKHAVSSEKARFKCTTVKLIQVMAKI